MSNLVNLVKALFGFKFDVRSFEAKIGCSNSITNRQTTLSSFDVRKNDVRVSSLSNLVNTSESPIGFDVCSFERQK